MTEETEDEKKIFHAPEIFEPKCMECTLGYHFASSICRSVLSTSFLGRGLIALGSAVCRYEGLGATVLMYVFNVRITCFVIVVI